MTNFKTKSANGLGQKAKPAEITKTQAYKMAECDFGKGKNKHDRAGWTKEASAEYDRCWTLCITGDN